VVATPEERAKLLDTAAPNLAFFILLCADLGLRHKTAAGIRAQDYNPKTRTLTFRTKGAVTQSLPVSNEVARIIEALPPGADRGRPIVALLQTTRRGSITGSNPRFSRQWERLKEKAGVRRELHIHDLRRTAAEEVWDATLDIRAVQAQLGHQSPTTTARYLANRVTQKDLQRVREKVDAMRANRERTP
jgi:integrase